MLITAASFLALPSTASAQDWRRGVYGGSWMDTSESSATPRRSERAERPRRVARSSYDDDERPQRRGRIASRASSGGGGGGGGGSGQSGMASYYWQPQRVASGGWFNPNAMTAAHKTLPFGTKVRVTNQRNGQSVVVTINDRGPYIAGRVIDLSSAAAGVIGMKGAGVVPVSISRAD